MKSMSDNPDSISDFALLLKRNKQLQSLASQQKDNIVHVLYEKFSYPLIIPSNSYHTIGRGYGFGFTQDYRKLDGTFFTVLTPYHIKDYGKDLEGLFLVQYMKHEIIGHANLCLEDHFSKSGLRYGCLMVPRINKEDVIGYLRNLDEDTDEIKVCSSCSHKIKKGGK